MQASRVPAAPAADNTSVCLSGLFALGLVPHSTLCLFCYSFPCACVRVSAQRLHVFLACEHVSAVSNFFFQNVKMWVKKVKKKKPHQPSRSSEGCKGDLMRTMTWGEEKK